MKIAIQELNAILANIRGRQKRQPMQLHVNLIAFLESEKRRLSTASDVSDPPANPPLPPGDPDPNGGDGH